MRKTMIKYFLIITTLLVFTGCNEERREALKQHYTKGGKVLCRQVESQGRYFTKYHEERVIDKDNYQFIDHDNYIVDNEYKLLPYYIGNCSILHDKDIFIMGKNRYVLINEKPQPLKGH